MKIALSLALLCATAVGGGVWIRSHCCCCSSGCETAPAANEPIGGQYVEARTASVFAGACHHNSELVTAGREQVLAWSIQAGTVDGVHVGGVGVVAAVGCEENLEVATAPRKSVIYVDRTASDRQREIVVEWVRAHHAAALGTVLAIEPADVEVDSDGDHYHVKVGDTIALDGSAMPDRACCSQPFNVWYEPAEKIEGRLVGCSKQFTCSEPRLGVRWTREGANDAFLGRFGSPATL
jgi:hypothetical protein